MRLLYSILILIIALYGITFLACNTPDESNEKGSSDTDDDDTAGDDDNDDNTPDYDNLDNLPEDVWSDPDSGLMWQVWPKAKARFTYYTAINHCNSLIYGGYDEWRLPSISELRSVIRGCPGTQIEGSCGVADTCNSIDCWDDKCYGCIRQNGPAEGIYWPNEFSVSDKYYYGYFFLSSTKYPATDLAQDHSWCVDFYVASIDLTSNKITLTARCVR